MSYSSEYGSNQDTQNGTSNDAKICEQQGNRRENVMGFLIRFYLQPSIAMFGIVLNSLVLIGMLSSRINASKTAKFYYVLMAIGDLQIMFKIMTVFLFQLKCFLDYFQLCEIMLKWRFFWKFAMATWLIGEIISNYSIMLLSFERLLAITNPMRSRLYLSLKRNVITFIIVTLPMIIYIGSFSILLYDPIPTNGTVTGYIVDIPSENPHSSHFKHLSKLFCILIPTFTSLILSIVIIIKLRFILAHRSKLMCGRGISIERKVNSNSIVNRPGSLSLSLSSQMRKVWKTRTDIRPSLVALTLSIVKIVLYLPAIICFVLIDLDKHFSGVVPPSLQPFLTSLGIALFNVSGLPHVGNFLVYYFFIPSFNRKYTCNPFRYSFSGNSSFR